MPMPPRETARCLGEHGWRVSELSEEHGHALLAEGEPGRVGGAFRRAAAAVGMTFPQGHLIMGSGSLDQRRVFDAAPADAGAFEAAQEELKRWIDLFQAVGVRCAVLHPGGTALAAAGWEPARVRARRVDAIRRAAGYARGSGVVLCLENDGASGDPGVQTAAGLLDLVRAAGDGVALCLDTGHANLAGVDIPRFIAEAGPHLRALHIADNLGRHDDHMLPCGAGAVPWPAVLAALRAARYDDLFNFEVPGESRACPLPLRLAKLDYARVLGESMVRALHAAPGTPEAGLFSLP